MYSESIGKWIVGLFLASALLWVFAIEPHLATVLTILYWAAVVGSVIGSLLLLWWLSEEWYVDVPSIAWVAVPLLVLLGWSWGTFYGWVFLAVLITAIVLHIWIGLSTPSGTSHYGTHYGSTLPTYPSPAEHPPEHEPSSEGPDRETREDMAEEPLEPEQFPEPMLGRILNQMRSWSPHRFPGKEQPLQDMLVEHLRVFFPELRHQVRLDKLSKIDAVISGTGIEIKRDPDIGEVDRLLGQIDRYMKHLNHIVVYIYFAKIDMRERELVDNLMERLKERGWLKSRVSLIVRRWSPPPNSTGGAPQEPAQASGEINDKDRAIHEARKLFEIDRGEAARTLRRAGFNAQQIEAIFETLSRT